MKPNRRFTAIESAAASWLVRRDAGLTAGEEAEFGAWRDRDPRHAAALAEIAALWHALDHVSEGESHAALRGRLAHLARRDRRRLACAIPLALAAGLAVVFWLVQRPESQSLPGSPRVAASPTGARVLAPERRLLADGSIVELKAGAVIDVVLTQGERRVALRNGEAHFAVAPDPARPFVVTVGNVSVRAVGTAFAIEKTGREVGVIVTEGTVRVGAASDVPAVGSPPPVVLTAGGRMVVSPEGMPRAPSTLGAEELAERLSWRVPRLDFSEATVGAAAELFNAHGGRRLRVADAATAALRITGVFRVDNIEGFVRALEVGLGIRAERGPDGILLRGSG